jgi:hypothetical protein
MPAMFMLRTLGGDVPRTSRRGLAVVRDGARVPGIYADLLQRERERHERYRPVWADAKDPAGGVFCRPTFLLDALEAGLPVTVAGWQLCGRRVSVPAHMRPGSAPAAWWRVTADDVVERRVSPDVDRIRAPRRAPCSNRVGYQHGCC